MDNNTAGRRIKYSRNSKTISGRLHDELVMMDLEQGKYFSLNPVATRIWDLLEKPKEAAEICSVLMDEYDVSSDQCLIEVEELLDEMGKMGLVLRVEV
ncbi:MAG: PqqD family protein [Bacteroidales bacterium]|nr:PqqD family protein [Bacteroidales bacterium]